jgi:ribonuclease P protein component
VQRNRIKRLMREVYRKNKFDLYTLLKNRNEQYALLLVYTGKTIPPFEEVRQKLTLTLQRFANEIEKNSL